MTRYEKPYLLTQNLHRELGTIPCLFLTFLGDVVRIQPNHISFNDLKAHDDIYGNRTKTNKGDMYSTTSGTPQKGVRLSLVTEVYALLRC
jgi:hypothetical protein